MTPTAAARLALVEAHQMDRESEMAEHENVKESRAAALKHAENAANDILAGGLMSAVGKGLNAGAAFHGASTGQTGIAGSPNDPSARSTKTEALAQFAGAGLDIGSSVFSGLEKVQSAKQQEEFGNADLALTAKNNHAENRRSAIEAMKEITQAEAQAAQAVLRG